MRYQCPQCGSLKEPVVNYFPPIIVQCLDRKTKGPEKKFIQEDQAKTAPFHYIH
ncbi:MAG: hypothetical protein ACFFHV_12370 [Promethearchaeota archaeon]